MTTLTVCDGRLIAIAVGILFHIYFCSASQPAWEYSLMLTDLLEPLRFIPHDHAVYTSALQVQEAI